MVSQCCGFLLDVGRCGVEAMTAPGKNSVKPYTNLYLDVKPYIVMESRECIDSSSFLSHPEFHLV